MSTAELLDTVRRTPRVDRAYRDRGFWRDRTHLDDLRDRAARDPDRTVLVDRSGGDREEIDAGALADRTARVAAGLRAAGVRPRDAVAYQTANRWEAVATLYACAHVGAVAVPMTTSLGPTQVEQRLVATGAVVALVGPESLATLRDLVPRLASLHTVVALDARGDTGDGVVAFDDVVPATAPAGLEHGDDEIGADDVALVLFTSGTTGHSKAVLHTANTLWASTRSMVGELVDDVGTVRVLTTSVLTHVIGIMVSALGPVVLGRPAVLTDARGPAELLDVVATERVTHLLVGPTGLDTVLDALDRGASRPGCLRVVALGGAPVAQPVLDKAGRLPAELRIHWGMTEVPGGGASTGHDPEGTSWHTMGHATNGLERVLDRDGSESGGNGVGEVRVRGPQVTVGLLDSADGSVVWSPAEHDGWFRTGDLASTDATGELVFLDRAADEIKGASGMLIPTAEVEDLVVSHPDVDEAVLVAHRPGAQQEVPAAIVVPQPGREPTLDDVRRHLLERGTTSWYLPERLLLVDRLDRDPAGKVDKRALRAWLEG